MRHWVCFDCRKQFRRAERESTSRLWTGLPSLPPAPRVEIDRACAECGGRLVDMGRFFRPPKRRDRRAWAELRRMAVHGFRFTHGGVYGYIRYALRNSPGRLKAEVMITECSCHWNSPGKRLLRAIGERRRG